VTLFPFEVTLWHTLTAAAVSSVEHFRLRHGADNFLLLLAPTLEMLTVCRYSGNITRESIYELSTPMSLTPRICNLENVMC
jgi:hypothetical protein